MEPPHVRGETPEFFLSHTLYSAGCRRKKGTLINNNVGNIADNRQQLATAALSSWCFVQQLGDPSPLGG